MREAAGFVFDWIWVSFAAIASRFFSPCIVGGIHGTIRGRTALGSAITRECRVVKEGDLVAIFHSIHRVMKAEKLLKQAGKKVLLIPVPRQLTSDCGLAIRFAQECRAEIEDVLSASGLEVQELYLRQQKVFVRLNV